ncbi:hypothetical protein [Algoriphagus sp. NG3]|uniref:hypothetical protein n=1 Tax=Algoriphagus sp. NG3 TaxID=3097546 RepID=UPI002A831820|nr:hypothetical protein [Algoriphagus sp. NG3]WPR75232.1 hypothetical protein SLW71_21455 [Algoriphagus sp. NG3]
MKSNTLNLLRGGVFSLAVVAAFAFTQPKTVDQYAQDPNTGIWYNVTTTPPGPNTYFCDPMEDSFCKVDAPNESGAPIDPEDVDRYLRVNNANNLIEENPH